jgi:hypothetical protein
MALHRATANAVPGLAISGTNLTGDVLLMRADGHSGSQDVVRAPSLRDTLGYLLLQPGSGRMGAASAGATCAPALALPNRAGPSRECSTRQEPNTAVADATQKGAAKWDGLG